MVYIPISAKFILTAQQTGYSLIAQYRYNSEKNESAYMTNYDIMHIRV